MPKPNTTPRAAEAEVEDELNTELDELVPQIAAEEGLAKGAVHLSPEREVALWGQFDPTVDPDTLKQQLMAGQVPPELYDPQSDRRLALLRMLPHRAQEWADEVFSQPLDEEMADLVAGLAERPGVAVVLDPYEDDPKGRVVKAESVHARWLRRQGMAPAQPAAPAPDDGGAY